MNWVIRPKKIFLDLVYVSLGLTLINAALLLAGWLTGHTYMLGFMELFNTGKESNIPTWFSSFMLLLAAVFLHIITFMKQSGRERHVLHWRILSIIFLYLSIDEASSVHERLGVLIGRVLNLQVLITYGWLVPGVIVAAIVALLFVPFLINLPPTIRRLFIIAGVLYLGGASGMEAVSLKWGLTYGMGTIHYRLLTTIEEFLEMMGTVVFIYALTLYIAEHITKNRLVVQFMMSDDTDRYS